MSHQLAVPFHPQIWDLENWQQLGFASKEEARYWQDSSCGVLCLKMALEGLLGEEIGPIAAVIRRGREIGAYSHKTGWSHQGLAELARQYGVTAQPLEGLRPDDLVKLLDGGVLVIVSIKWAFEPRKTVRERLTFWKKRGGHLALVIGHDEGRRFYVHHTSIAPGYNWENKHISLDRFKKGFTGRGIIVYGK
ncbi:MAG: C39 family peptidase [Candidatus Paceibacterota bacterium]